MNKTKKKVGSKLIILSDSDTEPSIQEPIEELSKIPSKEELSEENLNEEKIQTLKQNDNFLNTGHVF